MNAVSPSAKIIPFPQMRLWSEIAAKYVHYMVDGDPRAGFYFLEYRLKELKLPSVPRALQYAIDREYRKRGFARPIRFLNDG